MSRAIGAAIGAVIFVLFASMLATTLSNPTAAAQTKTSVVSQTDLEITVPSTMPTSRRR